MKQISKTGITALLIGGVCVLAIGTFQLSRSAKSQSMSRTDRMIVFIENNFPKFLINPLDKFIQSRNKLVAWNDDIQQRLVWGYVDRHSITPGESFRIMLSTDAMGTPMIGRIEISRIGYYEKTDRFKVWESDSLTVQKHPISFSGGTVGPGWPAYVSQIPTTTWTSGYYTINFVHVSGTRDEHIAYIVVTPEELNGDILVKLSTNTYQAYNSWGGASFYLSPILGDQGNMVTFDRPTPTQFFDWEYYYILWLEELANTSGIIVHYATDFDIHRQPEYSDRYPLLISVGHDEYWSREEFSHIYERIFSKGKNTLFLGANTAFNQIRFADVNSTISDSFEGRHLIFYRNNVDPIVFKTGQNTMLDPTGRFSKDNRSPEIMLMGVSWESWFPYDGKTSYPYFVSVEPSNHFLFKGTGYTKGSSIGNLVGYEWDNTDPDPNNQRYWDPVNSQIPYLPREKLTVLFTGEPINYRGGKGKAEAVYFESDAGAKVFSSGTIQWPWGLTKEGFRQEAFRQFNKNLIESFLKEGTYSPLRPHAPVQS